MGINSASPHKPSAAPAPTARWPRGTGRQRAATPATDLQRERILQDGAIPAKYKILMTMIVGAVPLSRERLF